MKRTSLLRIAALTVVAAAVLPAGTAHAKDGPRRAPAPAPVTAAAPAGPLDVTRLEIDLGPAGENPVGALADISVEQTVRAEQLTVAVRPAGGTWDATLSFARVGPITLESWQPVQLNSERDLPAGRYEAFVAVRIDGAWVQDEVVAPFAVS